MLVELTEEERATVARVLAQEVAPASLQKKFEQPKVEHKDVSHDGANEGASPNS